MKLIKKVVNEIIEKHNEMFKLEDPSEYSEQSQEYVERLNRMIKKSRIPFVDDDADVDELIEVMAGLSYGYGVRPSSLDGFTNEFRIKLSEQLAVKLGYDLAGEITPIMEANIIIAYFDLMYDFFNSAQKINYAHLMLREDFDTQTRRFFGLQ